MLPKGDNEREACAEVFGNVASRRYSASAGHQPSMWGEPGATPRQQEGETDGKDKKGGTHWALLHSPVMASD